MGKNLANTTHTFLFCDGGSCQRAGSEQVVREARAYLRNNGYWNTTHTIKTRCNGRCEDAPTCIVHPDESWYKELTPEKIIPIIKSHLDHDIPVEADLLYRKGWDEVHSDKERTPIRPKPFELKNDDDLGSCFLTKGFSSDQYLYPLFLYLQQNPSGVSFVTPDKEHLPFEEFTAIDYAKGYTLDLHSKNAIYPLVIAAVPKENTELRHTKVAITEYFYQIETGQSGIRFKNKFGKTLAGITFDSIVNKAWEYCTKIQLQERCLDLTQL
jgi:(2Fe-2S) ferredoxin